MTFRCSHCVALVCALAVALPGCVERRLTVRSNPPGAALRRRLRDRHDARLVQLHILRSRPQNSSGEGRLRDGRVPSAHSAPLVPILPVRFRDREPRAGTDPRRASRDLSDAAGHTGHQRPTRRSSRSIASKRPGRGGEQNTRRHRAPGGSTRCRRPSQHAAAEHASGSDRDAPRAIPHANRSARANHPARTVSAPRRLSTSWRLHSGAWLHTGSRANACAADAVMSRDRRRRRQLLDCR